LGLPDKANFKALLGSVIHKTMELLAKKKLAQQNNEDKIQDESGTYPVTLLNESFCLDLAYTIYSKAEPSYDWDETNFKLCEKWLDKTLTYNNGIYNPINQNIYFVEKFFNIELPYKWARYSYNLAGKSVNGQLALKGHIDLGVMHPGNIIEVIDYKTGKRTNYETNRPKTFEELYDDFQLRLYHYVISKLYPNVNQVLLTIFFINDGGPITLPYDNSMLEDTELRIKQEFLSIKNKKKPSLIFPHWKCYKLCSYYANKIGDKTVCQHINDRVNVEGVEKVTADYTDLIKIGQYSSGGGTTGVKE
jgi:hypothetical protein